jgi:hypothetical protein
MVATPRGPGRGAASSTGRISVGPGQDDALVLAVAIVVDQISHPRR